ELGGGDEGQGGGPGASALAAQQGAHARQHGGAAVGEAEDARADVAAVAAVGTVALYRGAHVPHAVAAPADHGEAGQLVDVDDGVDIVAALAHRHQPAPGIAGVDLHL